MNLITEHPAVCAIAAYWVFSAIIGGMPEPTPDSSAGYIWLHSSLHILSGNLATAMQTRFPSIPINVPPGSTVQQTTTQKTNVTTPEA